MGLLNALSGMFSAAPARDAAVDHAFEVIAKTIEPAVTSLPDSRTILEPAVRTALAYYQQSIATIPGPVDISAEAWPTNPVARSLFTSADEVAEGIGRSLALRSSIRWFVDHNHEDVYAMVGMRVRPRESGGGFTDHTFRSLGTHDQDCRECLREAAFTSLVKAFDTRMKEKRREWRLRHTDLRLSDELRSRNGDDPGLPFTEDQRDEILDRHAGASHDLTPERALQALVEWLGRPDKQLLVSDSEAHPPVGNGADVRMPVLASADRRRWFVCMVRFPLPEALSAISQETQPHRYILI